MLVRALLHGIFSSVLPRLRELSRPADKQKLAVAVCEAWEDAATSKMYLSGQFGTVDTLTEIALEFPDPDFFVVLWGLYMSGCLINREVLMSWKCPLNGVDSSGMRSFLEFVKNDDDDD